ncbi:unnamed protein product [Brachionus calyciflorus]|uniref:DOMON domain-containing protein n=1 Tax=Brachionus calyciflorus TaxID=104777 RepID=A0A813VJR7_9BILA|nr:unnamed protein product [Brachionus calyciflorus]
MKFLTCLVLFFSNVLLAQFQILPPLPIPSSITVANAVVTWANLGNETQFTVTSNLGRINASNAWISVGVNTESAMSAGNVVVCQNLLSETTISHNLNAGYSSAPFISTNPTIGLKNARIGVVGSNLTCSFSRANFVDIASYIKIDSLSNLHILVAYGAGNFGYHFGNRGSSVRVFFPLPPNNQTSTPPPFNPETQPPRNVTFFPIPNGNHSDNYTIPFVPMTFQPVTTTQPNVRNSLVDFIWNIITMVLRYLGQKLFGL